MPSGKTSPIVARVRRAGPTVGTGEGCERAAPADQDQRQEHSVKQRIAGHDDHHKETPDEPPGAAFDASPLTAPSIATEPRTDGAREHQHLSERAWAWATTANAPETAMPLLLLLRGASDN